MKVCYYLIKIFWCLAAGGPGRNVRLGAEVAGWWKRGGAPAGAEDGPCGIRPVLDLPAVPIPLRFLLFFKALCSAAFSAISILFSSPESSASSSAVYSATTPHPWSDRSAILINFCRSASGFLPFKGHTCFECLAARAYFGGPRSW